MCLVTYTLIQQPFFTRRTTVNQETFVYEDVHVLNVRVNKIFMDPYKNFVIVVHVLLHD